MRLPPHAEGAPPPHRVSFALYLQTIQPRLLATSQSGVRYPRPLSLGRCPRVASTGGLHPAPPCPLPRLRLMQRRRLLAASAAEAAAASTLSSRPQGTPGCPSLVRCFASSAASTPARPLCPGRGRAYGSGGRLRARAGGSPSSPPRCCPTPVWVGPLPLHGRTCRPGIDHCDHLKSDKRYVVALHACVPGLLTLGGRAASPPARASFRHDWRVANGQQTDKNTCTRTLVSDETRVHSLYTGKGWAPKKKGNDKSPPSPHTKF